MDDRIKRQYDEKIAEAQKNEGKIVRIWAGTYILFKNGKKIGIQQTDEQGDFKNWWVVECLSDLDSEIIKVKTLKEAKNIALNWKFND